jgi:hypothetical protein
MNATNREKTLEMRILHIFYRLDSHIRALKADGKLLGPRTSKYYLSQANSLQSLLNELKEELPNINYLDVK